MAASTQKNDLIQIVMLTFFLCTVFFTGLGIWSSVKVEALREERDRNVRRLEDMKKELLTKDAIQAVKDERARQKSAENSAQIDTAVNSVLASSSLKIKSSSDRGSRPVGGGGEKMLEYSYDMTFEPAPIDQVLRFLGLLEAKQPHLEFKKLKIRSKKRNPEDPDIWELDISLTTYSGA